MIFSDYNSMFSCLDKHFQDTRELCGINITVKFLSMADILMQGRNISSIKMNDVLALRKKYELHFHNFLEHQLFTRLQEIKYYSTVDILNTRRLVSISSDCISLIQIIVRDEINLIVHFRSSDYDGALPVDLEFLSSLPFKLTHHLGRLKDAEGYEEVTDDLLERLGNKKVNLNLSFGSLHKTA